jgi:DNA-binding Lrp family transcriptional regulator
MFRRDNLRREMEEYKEAMDYLYRDDSDDYESEEEYRRRYYGRNAYNSESDSDSDDDYYLDEMQERFIRELKRMIYLGPLYKKCDSRKIGTTEKELKNRLEYLKKANRVRKNCSVSEFIDICKLHMEPLEADSCYVNFKEMVKGFTVDSIKSFMLSRRLHEDMFSFLLNEFENELNLSINILVYAIYLNYSETTISRLLRVLEEKNIYIQNETVEISYNKLFWVNLGMKIFENNYSPILVTNLIQYFNIPIYLNILFYIPTSKLLNYNYFEVLLQSIPILEFDDAGSVADNILDLIQEILNEGYEGYERDIILIYNNFTRFDRDLIKRVDHVIKERVDLYEIENMDIIKILIKLRIIKSDLDLEEYNEELVARQLQREQGIDATNVHSVANNTFNNKIIRTLIPNPNKTRDVLNLEFTTNSANEFIEILNRVNTDRELRGKPILNVNADDVLRCRDYFYDYADRLMGRDRTPPGEGVEVCNIFVKIWELAKEQLNEEQMLNYTERLGEEFASILQKDNANNPNPVCSTGWGMRLVNSIIGTAIDVGVVPAPDIKVVTKELTHYIYLKRKELDESKDSKDMEEAEAYDDSVAMISDDNFEIAKKFIEKRLPGFINKFYQDYKFTGIRKKQVRELANEAKEKLFTA